MQAGKTLTVSKELIGPPGTWNPTLFMFLISLSLLGLAVGGYGWWLWPRWLVFFTNLLALHLAGTVIHDACHNSAHPNRIVNAALGHGAALMLGFVFPVFTRVHIQHHAHVNDPDNDPDYYVSHGGPLWLIAPRFFYHEVYFFQRRLWRKFELLEWFLSRAILIGTVYTCIQIGWWHYFITYWGIPLMIVGYALGLFFDYLPHRPFVERHRWRNARVYPSAVLNVLILGQNYHLIHHLWPSIPWYLYQRGYHEAKPLLEAHGSPQCLGILESRKALWSFVYDLFLGIHLPHRSQASADTAPALKVVDPTEPNDTEQQIAA
ncbi:beta-carotene hydroxylase [Leptolyngbya sp. FACHB-261]|uniref:beta-carotene hydroxylase n=1 Tax=Leptolyngbya sp. FACHB-261 TaxID=2692806 RepID=UPI001685FD2E|nr:fatty acid desaturase [Leptolyngbya sp. FACHB-261]MBD2101552.1 fatty acid desaturase [Leptolyngbya sp. FACHB-261]